MKILYNPQNGEIFHVVKEIDWAYFSHTTNIALEIGEIPETEETQLDRIEILQSVNQVNGQGQKRFHVDLQTLEVVEREGWTEFVE